MLQIRMILAAAIVTFATQAIAGGMKVEPGKWEFRSTSVTPMATSPQLEVTTECIKDEEISPQNFMEDAQGCTLTDSEATDSTMKWKMSCPGPGGEMTGEGEVQSTGGAIRGSMKMAMAINGQSMDFKMEWEGKRIGPCD